MFRTLALRFRRVPSDEPRAPWPRRVGRWLRRRRRWFAFAGLIAAGLCWAVWPHFRARSEGWLAERRGHDVKWGHYIPEERRRFVPLPTEGELWTTPVSISINGGLMNDGPGARDESEALSDALDRVERMPAVTEVAVSDCAVSVADARRFAAIHKGEDLRFSRCDFAPAALAAIAERGGFENVNLSGCSLPPGELSGFAGRSADGAELSFLNLRGAEGVGGQFAAFAGHPRLSGLNVKGTSFHDADLAAVASCARLRLFPLAETAITDAGLSRMANRVGPMNDLDLSRTAVTDAGFVGWPERPDLRELLLAETAITDATVRRLADCFPDLISLDLSGTQVTDDALPHLARLTLLQSLDLSGTRVTAAAADPVIDWPALRWLGLPWALIEEDPLLLIQGFRAERRDGPEIFFGPVPD